MDISHNRLGMFFFIGSEAVFFIFLIIVYLWHLEGVGVELRDHLDVGRTALFSLALFSSSGTAVFAERRLERRDLRGTRVWLVATILLGATFLLGQLWEFSELVNENFTLETGSFTSSFYLLTGFHGLHVFVGLILLSILGLLTRRRSFLRIGEGALKAISLYWHFVDVVWVVIFSLVYLWSSS